MGVNLDFAVTVLSDHSICYVYPSGEVIVTKKISRQERATLSGITHNYNLHKDLQRYSYKYPLHKVAAMVNKTVSYSNPI